MQNFSFTGKEQLDALSHAQSYLQCIRDWLEKDLIINAEVLDFGAGNGAFCNEFSAYKVCAIEPDESFFPNLNCPVVQSIDELDSKYDLIYSVNVLEHIDNDTDIARAFYNHLKQGGKVKVFVPAHSVLFTKMDEAVGHVRRYSRKNLISLFENAGFTVCSCRYFDFLGFFVTLIYKLIGLSGKVSPKSIRFYDRYLFPVSKLIDRITYGKLTGKNLILEAMKNIPSHEDSV